MPALFKGTVVNLVRVVPYGAFLFCTYELMRDFYTWVDKVGVPLTETESG